MINRRFDIHSHMRINSRTVGMTIAVSVLFMFIVGSYAFADVVPSCGTCGGKGYRGYDACRNNTYYLSRSECHAFCEHSEYCKPYADERKSVFGGFWSLPDSYLPEVYACRDECMAQKKQCDADDQACLDRFVPEVIDCALLTSDSEKRWCNAHCVDSILTSECGRSCLKNGVENALIAPIPGCQNTSYCASFCDETYCASIPMNYETKWNIFGILMALLAVFTGVMLCVIHKKDKAKDKLS
ncbi:MAG: hypothetical protein IKY83_13195 [Proteobacteria bacterium]|nr:hypothetical protein [Pseudomonadota bacterium]